MKITFPGPVAPPTRRKSRVHDSTLQDEIVNALKKSDAMFPFDFTGQIQCVYWAANKMAVDIQIKKLASGGWRIWNLGKRTK